jgi:hypothetical protein
MLSLRVICSAEDDEDYWWHGRVVGREGNKHVISWTFEDDGILKDSIDLTVAMGLIIIVNKISQAVFYLPLWTFLESKMLNLFALRSLRIKKNSTESGRGLQIAPHLSALNRWL